jgi:hypothetical protein
MVKMQTKSSNGGESVIVFWQLPPSDSATICKLEQTPSQIPSVAEMRLGMSILGASPVAPL